MEAPVPGTSKTSSPVSPELGISRSRLTRGRKRRRLPSESSSDTEPVLPENTLEVEKNLHAAAIKNNLDDVSVKKILKKVVTNDHVLALVKLREEEENMAMKVDSQSIQPKLTRAKVKELMKVSPKSAWNLELTPIKHIPVKTRPEVTALIAQELPDDEDDDEYEPTNDDVPSDDEHTLESCSDVDSQPRTPATPRRTASPRVLRDGPFKVPQDITPRRRLDMNEDATIALRTRSKLSLSSIPIDHIESSFVPPDELPMPAGDDVWTEFLQECLNPEVDEVDDEDDPEYNVAADPDAQDEDEEGLENIIKISKKELNDLVTELFNVMPEGLGEDDMLSGKLASEAAQNNEPPPSTHWEGKQEPLSDEETPQTPLVLSKEKRLSIGKSEPVSDTECQGESEKENRQTNTNPPVPQPPEPVMLSVVEQGVSAYPEPLSSTSAPAPLQSLLVTKNTFTVELQQVKVLPEQIEILQQQLRQHIQLAASNFLQLFVHPMHWSLAPTYKEYLETLNKITSRNPKSVANVCNLKPAYDLMNSWEKSVSADTPENAEMVKFVQSEIERSRRRATRNNLYVGDFHPKYMDVVANSPVFLYPHLLPPLPYRSDGTKRFSYSRCEDELIALGMDEFWQYVENNPEIYPPRPVSKGRWGLVATIYLVSKHMFPWILPKSLLSHIQLIKKNREKDKDDDNPINKFFATREVTPVKHVLLPFNPNLTLYEQPEHEMPRIWVRYLAKNSKRFRNHLYRRTALSKVTGRAPQGVPIDLGASVQPPPKNPLPIHFTQKITCSRLNMLPPTEPQEPIQDKYDLELTQSATTTAQDVLYSVIKTPAGSYLIPLSILRTKTVDSASTPICSSQVQDSTASNIEGNMPNFSVAIPNKTPEVTAQKSKDAVPDTEQVTDNSDATQTPTLVIVPIDEHCLCCAIFRKIKRQRQSLITDFFRTPKKITCPCRVKRNFKYPRITKKLKMLAENYKCKSYRTWQGMMNRMKMLNKELRWGATESNEIEENNLKEIAEITSFQLKLAIRTAIARDNHMKKKVYTLLSRFDPVSDNPCTLIVKMEKVFATECVDLYKELLGFLTMEQADKMGRFLDYFKQDSLTDLVKKIEELVPNKHHKEKILSSILQIVKKASQSACEICAAILKAVSEYPALAEYTFSLFPHQRKSMTAKAQDGKVAIPATPRFIVNKGTNPTAKPKNNKKVDNGGLLVRDYKKNDYANPPVIENIRNDNTGALATDNVGNENGDPLVIDNVGNENGEPLAMDDVGNENCDPLVTDKVGNENGEPLAMDDVGNENGDPLAIDDIGNESADSETTVIIGNGTADNMEDETMYDESQVMDYEADHSASDEEGSIGNLTIVEDPEEINQSLVCNVKQEAESENVMDMRQVTITVTKTETQDNSESSDSEMSTMLMSEDDIKIEMDQLDWKRDEDKLLLEILQRSLSPEEMKDKTLLEIIAQKKVLETAVQNLPDKTLDEVKKRILYLLEFLVLNK